MRLPQLFSLETDNAMRKLRRFRLATRCLPPLSQRGFFGNKRLPSLFPSSEKLSGHGVGAGMSDNDSDALGVPTRKYSWVVASELQFPLVE